jgi:hypothetical protein
VGFFHNYETCAKKSGEKNVFDEEIFIFLRKNIFLKKIFKNFVKKNYFSEEKLKILMRKNFFAHKNTVAWRFLRRKIKFFKKS